ncbi:MAG TPA: porin family protein [Cyclobacteriaceae bacterium]|nr:porin family protein [Cyclobacteriaceae bacterium]
MTRALIFFLFFLIGYCSFGQSNDACVQTLRLARATYEQGRLHEIEGQLKGCLEGGFTKDQKQLKVEGYKLLCLSYIYLEEPEKANEAMLNILRADHDFQINPAVDPAEFVGLYNTFRSKPMFSIGAMFGPNATLPAVTENYAVSGSSSGQGKYSPKVNIQIGLVFEKQLFGKFTAAPEISLSNRAFTYSNSNLFKNDSSQNSVASQTGEIQQTWLDLNLLMQYKLGMGALNSYVSFGPNVGMLTKATNTVETNYSSTGQVTSGSPLDITDNYNKLGFSLIGTAGIKYKFGAIYITANVRYQFGLSKIVNEDKRSHPEGTSDYVLGPNIYSQQNAAFLVGFVYPIFKPKKLQNK